MNAKVSSDLCRMLIVGNGGSGKTWLAGKLGGLLRHPVVHLDDLHWEPGTFEVARDKQRVASEVAAAGEADSWVMEGVYGWLATVVLNRATTLIWIDLPEEECIANVKQRGQQGGGSDDSFRKLLTWIADYRRRDTSSSFAGHARLYEAFGGSKSVLNSRGEIGEYLERLSRL